MGRRWDGQRDLHMLGAGFPLARWVERRELGVHQGPRETHRTTLSGSRGWEAWGRVVTGRHVGDAA